MISMEICVGGFRLEFRSVGRSRVRSRISTGNLIDDYLLMDANTCEISIVLA